MMSATLFQMSGRWFVALTIALSVVLAARLATAQTSVPSNPQLQEARRAYDATDFETARTLLTALINQWSASPDETTRPQLAAAYELRGRTLQNLRDLDGARSDWRTMLLLAPGYTFPVEAGPRALALFDEVRATTIGMVDIVLSPADAEVRVDGRPIADRPVRLALTDGPHSVTASRRSHRAAEQTFTIKAGEMTTVPLALERTQSTLTFSTAPGQVDVFINNERRGATQPEASGSASPEDASQRVSAPFVIEELPTGRYTLDLRAPCFVSEQRLVDVQRPQDIRLDTIRLTPARGEVSVQSNVADSRIVTSGAAGAAGASDMRPPQVLSLCAGPHVVQVQSPLGRDLRRYDLKTGQKEQFAARVRPAFALVPAGDATAAAAVGRDVRLSAEQAFRDTSAVMLFAADDGAATAPSVAAPERRAVVSKVTRDLGAQGLAVLSRQAGSADALTLALWAPGSGKPDLLQWRAGDSSSTAAITRRLDAAPILTRASLGLLAIDVIDVGVVVASTDAGGGASGLQPGDVIVSAGGKPLTAAAELSTAAESLAPGATLPIELRDRAGATRRVDLPVNRVPRVIDPLDQTVLPNTLAVSLTGRAQTRLTPVETASIRLNLAVAWIQAEAWPAAQAELDAVDAMVAKAALPQPVTDAIVGTSAYLRGVSAAKSGDAAAAERAWVRASQFTGPLLTESGGSIKDMAERRLASLRQPQGAQ
jgi:hypothetical protein